eukprot:TRINITY_DN3956_c0_g1_i1.p1 TRINITY_DN3956_c0_g1~~TRINITY_DN3956_c0_g1_i1.p1  ORF type:complete len:548 (+),score=28.41 TRINITY_DN3956_c0_g1_i1:61-1704(+)
MNTNTVLLVMLSLVIGTRGSYQLTRVGLTPKCQSDIIQVVLELVEGSNSCAYMACYGADNFNNTIKYRTTTCNETERSFNESLFYYGAGRNFSIKGFYNSRKCNELMAADAQVVDSCDGVENYECSNSTSQFNKCLYIPPFTPQEVPVAVPQSEPITAPTKDAPRAIPISTAQPQAPTAESSRPITKSPESDTNVIFYVILAAIVLSLTSGTVFLLVRRCRNTTKSKKIKFDPAESQGLLSVGVEPDFDNIRGRGSYSIVKSVIKDGKEFAEKKIFNNDAYLYEEYKIMRQLDHRNILKVHEFNAKSDTMPGLQTEMCDCSLAEKIGELADSDALLYIIQLASALRYLQVKLPNNKAVIHGDINPRNILFMKNHDVDKYKGVMLLKLADFGLAKMVSREAILPSFTPRDDEENYKGKLIDIWTAPEIDLHNRYSFVTDLYSFAVVCAQILLKKSVIDEETFRYDLAEAKTKKTAYHKEVATLCLEMMDYKEEPKDPNAKKVESKRPRTAKEVTERLFNFKRLMKTHYNMLSGQTNENSPQLAVTEKK